MEGGWKDPAGRWHSTASLSFCLFFPSREFLTSASLLAAAPQTTKSAIYQGSALPQHEVSMGAVLRVMVTSFSVEIMFDVVLKTDEAGTDVKSSADANTCTRCSMLCLRLMKLHLHMRDLVEIRT